jgi:hypothetical protein
LALLVAQSSVRSPEVRSRVPQRVLWLPLWAA